MNTAFLLNRFGHLRQFYKTEKEFTDHLLSGEVKMTIPDVIKAFEEYQQPAQALPSRFQVDDRIIFTFAGVYLSGEVLNVHFLPGKVKYDLELIAGDDRTRIYNIDSVHVLEAHLLT